MKIFVILSFLGCFVTAKAAITIDCSHVDVNNCATPETPCDVQLDGNAGFELDEVVVMTYTQIAVDGEASCNSVAPPAPDKGCEEYTSGEFYYKVIDISLPNADDVTFGTGFFAACVEACAESTSDPFSGYCQAVGECTAIPDACTGAKSPVGEATFVKYQPPAELTPIVIDCNKSDADDCGTVDTPCSISVHSAAGYEVGAVIIMTYSQVETDPETSCDGSKCEVYTSEQVYYEVEDVDAPNPDQVVLSENGFRPVCSEACALAAGEAFSGYCQAENGCAFISGDCDKGGANPVGAIDLQAYVPPSDATKIVIDCDNSDDNDCGNVEKPCSISLHSGAGFDEGDVIIMTYTQEKVDNEASCDATGASDKGCEAYTVDEVYYTVLDLDVATEKQVVMREQGFRPACTEACALAAGEEFSGYCQVAQECAFISGGCDKGGAHPVGEATFKKHDPTDTTTLPPGATTPSAATTKALAPVCAAVAALAMFT